jgi:hypothetical protein
MHFDVLPLIQQFLLSVDLFHDIGLVQDILPHSVNIQSERLEVMFVYLVKDQMHLALELSGNPYDLNAALTDTLSDRASRAWGGRGTPE